MKCLVGGPLLVGGRGPGPPGPPLNPALISRSQHFLKSNIGKTARLEDKVTIAQDEKYLRYGIVLCLVTLTNR